MNRRTLIIILALVAVGAIAFVATRRNDETGQTAAEHAINAADSKIEQYQAEGAAAIDGSNADANFNNAQNAGNPIDAAGNAVEGVGDSIQEGANNAEAEMHQNEAASQADAAKEAVVDGFTVTPTTAQ